MTAPLPIGQTDHGMTTWLALFDDLWDTDRVAAHRMWSSYVAAALRAGRTAGYLLKWDFGPSREKVTTISGTVLS